MVTNAPRARWRLLLALLLSFAATRATRAQLPAQPMAWGEYRVDGIFGDRSSVQGGAGVVLPLGIYVRLALDGAAGTTWRGDDSNASGRVDATARFLLDPFREIPVALSFGGGVSAAYVAHDDHVRPFLTTVVDVEGRRHGAFTPALEVGLGGGARVGIVLRTSPSRWR